MVLKMLEFRAVSSIIWLNRGLEILEMADLQGQGKQGVTVNQQGSTFPMACRTAAQRLGEQSPHDVIPPAGGHQANPYG